MSEKDKENDKEIEQDNLTENDEIVDTITRIGGDPNAISFVGGIPSTEVTETTEEEVELPNDDDDNNATTTTEVIFNSNLDEDGSGLTEKQILMAILGTLNQNNKLSQERNKRLRDLNKTLRKMAGISGAGDITLQGTPPNTENQVIE